MNSPEVRLRAGIHVGQLTQKVPGGIGRVTSMLCRGLPGALDVTALTSGSPSARRKLERDYPRVCFRDIGFGPQNARYELWHRFRRPVIDFDLDVVHAPSLAVPACRAPLVVSVNDLAFLRHPETSTRHGIRFHERGLDIARREAAAVIAPSCFVRSELLAEGFDEHRVHLVPLAGKSVDSRPAAAHWRTLAGLGVQEPFVLAVGTVEPRKDYATLVAAFARVHAKFPDATLVIAGAPGWLPDRERRHLQGPGVLNIGTVPEAQLGSLYALASVFVSASVYEGFGLDVLEAMTNGRPVIASDIPPHREVAGDAARFFTARDDVGLAELLQELLVDAEGAARLGTAAATRSGTFAVNEMISRHVDVYRAVGMR